MLALGGVNNAWFEDVQRLVGAFANVVGILATFDWSPGHHGTATLDVRLEP